MSYRFSQRSLNNLKGVNESLVKWAYAFLEATDYDFIVVEGLRTKERQKELVAQGVSWTMNSRHITGGALDIYPVDWKSFEDADWNQFVNTGLEVAEELGINIGNGLIMWGKDNFHWELR